METVLYSFINDISDITVLRISLIHMFGWKQLLLPNSNVFHSKDHRNQTYLVQIKLHNN